MAWLSPLHARHFAATKTAAEISTRLRADEELIDAQKPCSWVAWHLPGYDTKLGKDIATCLAPGPELEHEIKKLIYENVLGRIRRYLKNGGPNVARHAAVQGMEDVHRELLPEELSAALKVMVYLQEKTIIEQDTPAESITAWLQARVLPHAEDTTCIPKAPPIPRKRLCYICRLAITRAFPSHPSLCVPCGAFNHASSQLSMPPRLTLPRTFTALVTGARVNLGYHTALRLLRCGAQVIATTRYPHDAIVRYIQEPDSHLWEGQTQGGGRRFQVCKRCACTRTRDQG